MLDIGSVLNGRYKILDQICKGGMSVVYLACDEKLNQSCAIKEVRKDVVKDFEGIKQMLAAEANILKRLKHPRLSEIKDIIDTSDSFVIVMELVDGRSMDKVLEENGALQWQYVVEWTKQICDARTDIYTLGATMYHLVTGYSPNPSAPPYYGMVPVRQVNPSLPIGLERVILKCCQQKPEDRYQDCLEVIYALMGKYPEKKRRFFRRRGT